MYEPATKSLNVTFFFFVGSVLHWVSGHFFTKTSHELRS